MSDKIVRQKMNDLNLSILAAGKLSAFLFLFLKEGKFPKVAQIENSEDCVYFC